MHRGAEQGELFKNETLSIKETIFYERYISNFLTKKKINKVYQSFGRENESERASKIAFR
jgi:hypothetical protein